MATSRARRSEPVVRAPMFALLLGFLVGAFCPLMARATAAQLVSDLSIKNVALQRYDGKMWVGAGTGPLVAGVPYRLAVLFGNTQRVKYEDEQYRKDNVSIRLVAEGFKTATGAFTGRDWIVFCLDPECKTPKASPSYRVGWFFATYETTDLDVTFLEYVKFEIPAGQKFYAKDLYWGSGIYASVRNRVWTRKATGYQSP